MNPFLKPYQAVLKQLFSLALPIIFANLISASSGLISMLFIASINHNALAAGAIITSTQGLITVMVVSVLYSVGILIGQAHGAGRDSEIRPIIVSGITIACLFGLPLSGVLCGMTSILHYLHQPPAVSELVGQYFQGMTYGLIPSLISAVFTQFFMGITKAKLILYFTTVGVLVNIVISYMFIFGTSMIEPMGVLGAGLASSITSYLLLAALLGYVYCNAAFKTYRMLSTESFDLRYCKLLLQIGMPISIQYTLELCAFSIITYLMGLLGTEALGAQQITLQCSMVAIMVVMGFSQSGSILISQSLRQSTSTDRQMIANSTIGVGCLFMLSIGLVYWAFPDILIALYLDIQDSTLSETVSLARILLYIAAFTQLFDGMRNIAAGLLRGYGDTKSSLWTSLMACWVLGLPLALFFAFSLDFGAKGLRLGIMFGILFGCIHLLSRLHQTNKKPLVSPFYHNETKAL